VVAESGKHSGRARPGSGRPGECGVPRAKQGSRGDEGQQRCERLRRVELPRCGRVGRVDGHACWARPARGDRGRGAFKWCGAMGRDAMRGQRRRGGWWLTGPCRCARVSSGRARQWHAPAMGTARWLRRRRRDGGDGR